MFEGFLEERIGLPNGITLNVRHAGDGAPVLLLHGYPQTSACWHLVAPKLLAAGYRVIVPDLRGYGGSDKPASAADHSTYSKREMAKDQVLLMRHFGHERFILAGHDRGARVSHRLTLDYPECVSKVGILDIAPTATMYAKTDKAFATGYYHWFFLIQPAPLPETLISADAGFYLRSKLGAWGRSGMSAFSAEALDEYQRCFDDPDCISATCEDYRAAATIDLEHDRSDAANRIACPLLVLWGGEGLMGQLYDIPAVWREKADHVEGHALPCGHFLAEEQPEMTAEALLAFFARS
ncbi:MAG: alpha/beta hydrolase [Pseudomonadota bacterium]